MDIICGLDGLINLINSGLTTWKNPGFSSGFTGVSGQKSHNGPRSVNSAFRGV